MKNEILNELIGKKVSHIYEINDYSLSYCIEFSDGTIIEFHGGSIGYENANAWYNIETPNTSISGKKTESHAEAEEKP